MKKFLIILLLMVAFNVQAQPPRHKYQPRITHINRSRIYGPMMIPRFLITVRYIYRDRPATVSFYLDDVKIVLDTHSYLVFNKRGKVIEMHVTKKKSLVNFKI